MRYPLCIILTTILLQGPPAVFAQDTANIANRSVGKAVEAGFSEAERRLIEKYLGERSINREKETENKSGEKQKGGKKMPPGLARRDTLPPGLAMQLERNGTLPPGLAKRELPADLESQLPPVPKGYERSILEDASVVLVETASGRIADIIRGVVTTDTTPVIRD